MWEFISQMEEHFFTRWLWAPKFFDGIFTTIRLDTRPLTGICENFNQPDKFPRGIIFSWDAARTHTWANWDPLTIGPCILWDLRSLAPHGITLALTSPSKDAMRRSKRRHLLRDNTSWWWMMLHHFLRIAKLGDYECQRIVPWVTGSGCCW